MPQQEGREGSVECWQRQHASAPRHSCLTRSAHGGGGAEKRKWQPRRKETAGLVLFIPAASSASRVFMAGAQDNRDAAMWSMRRVGAGEGVGEVRWCCHVFELTAPQRLFNKGQSLLKANRFEEAEALFKAALADPKKRKTEKVHPLLPLLRC
eukprot:745950-Hanusia_phi.AAC.2